MMDEQLFQKYAAYIAQHFGIQLPAEKKLLLETRLFKMFNSLPQQSCTNAEQFFLQLEHDPSGKTNRLLADAITTNHTFFMREKDHFDFFNDTVLPFWAGKIKNHDLRTWCAACSTGEESYTLAMIINDFFALHGKHWDTSILATDLSPQALDTARRGTYSLDSIACMPRHWQQSYFKPCSETTAQVTPVIKENVIYRQFNLLEPVFPFKQPFHTIFCRNVMIYFDAPTRRTLARKFYDHLAPGGFLFVGHSETIEHQSAPFSYVMPSVYRRM